MSADLSDEIADITEATTVMDGALKLIRLFPSLLDKAKNEILTKGGATAEELKPLSDLSALLRSKAQELAQGVVDNTPAEEPTPE